MSDFLFPFIYVHRNVGQINIYHITMFVVLNSGFGAPVGSPFLLDLNLIVLVASPFYKSTSYLPGRPKKPGPVCFPACNFRNIDKICIKFGTNQVTSFLTLNHNLFESTLENKVAPSSE